MSRFIVTVLALAIVACQESGGEIERYDPTELEKEIAYDIETVSYTHLTLPTKA